MISLFGIEVLHKREEGIKIMKNNNISKIVFFVMLLVVIGLSVILVGQVQDTRKGAYFAKTAVLIKPTSFTKSVGEILEAEVWIVTEGEARVDGVEPYVCFGDKLIPATSDIKDSVIPNQEKKFSVVTKAVLDNDNKCIKFQVSSIGTDTDKLPSGAFKAATLRLKAKTVGRGTIDIVKNNTLVSGRNTNSTSTDTAIEVTSVEGASFSINDGAGITPTTPPSTPTTPPSADDMWINYKVAYAGVKKDRACAGSWPTKLTVLSGPAKKEYTNVPLTKTEAVNSEGEVIYEGSLQLVGFRQSNNVAVFFKGPKHLQVKYGKNGQNSIYNMAGGEISLTNVKETSPVLDFSGYPMLAGDIDGNGTIDGVDFATVKAKAARFTEIAAGGYMAEDLDGSCQVNNNDIILLVRSLNEKQDQVY